MGIMLCSYCKRFSRRRKMNLNSVTPLQGVLQKALMEQLMEQQQQTQQQKRSDCSSEPSDEQIVHALSAWMKGKDENYTVQLSFSRYAFLSEYLTNLKLHRKK